MDSGLCEERLFQKQTIVDLRIFGGNPAFEDPLHVGRPNVGNKEDFFKRLEEIFDQKWLTNNGPYVSAFERRIENLLEVNHCIAMCNGTVALEIASRALGLVGEVIVPSFTFIATAHALQWQEITPVFCDIAPGTLTIDPDQVESLITPRTTGILGVHIMGDTCNVSKLAEVAKKHNLKLLFDSCHALGCTYRGRMIGNFGDAEVLSFHATKFINTFEGGAVVTNDSELASKIRLMKNFGFAGIDDVAYIGINGKMNEVSAAMGLTSLDMLDHFISINRTNYLVYRDELSELNGVRVMRLDENEKCNYQYVVIEIDETVAGINRDEVLAVLHGENILARRYFYPGCHNSEPYRSLFPDLAIRLQNTEQAMKRVLCLPTGSSVNQSDIRKIAQVLRFTLENGAEIHARFTSEEAKLRGVKSFSGFRKASPFLT